MVKTEHRSIARSEGVLVFRPAGFAPKVGVLLLKSPDFGTFGANPGQPIIFNKIKT